MAEALRAKINWKSAFCKGVGQYRSNFCVKEDVPYQSFIHGQIGGWIPYNFVANSCHTKKLCSKPSSSEVRFYTENCRLAPLWWA